MESQDQKTKLVITLDVSGASVPVSRRAVAEVKTLTVSVKDVEKFFDRLSSLKRSGTFFYDVGGGLLIDPYRIVCIEPAVQTKESETE